MERQLFNYANLNRWILGAMVMTGSTLSGCLFESEDDSQGSAAECSGDAGETICRLQRQIDELNREILDAERRAAEARAETEEANLEAARLNAETAQLDRVRAELELENARTAAERDAALDALADAEERLAEAHAKIDELEARVEELEELVAGLEDQIERMALRIQELEEEIARLRAEQGERNQNQDRPGMTVTLPAGTLIGIGHTSIRPTFTAMGQQVGEFGNCPRRTEFWSAPDFGAPAGVHYFGCRLAIDTEFDKLPQGLITALAHTMNTAPLRGCTVGNYEKIGDMGAPANEGLVACELGQDVALDGAMPSVVCGLTHSADGVGRCGGEAVTEDGCPDGFRFVHYGDIGSHEGEGQNACVR